MRKIFLIFIGFIWMFLAACEDDDKEMSSDTLIRLSGKIAGMDEGEVVSRFRGGAGVGVYIADASESQTANLSGARVSNKKFMQSADGLVGDPLVYWNRENGIEFAAYYPYLKEDGDELKACSFRVAERQDTLLNGLPAYEESDFLWVRGRADFQTDPVSLEFKHLMSKVIIYLKSDAMIPGDMVGSDVNVLGIAMNAKIDLNEGTVVAGDETGQVLATDEVMQKDGFEIAVKAIIVPQTIKRGVKWLDIKTLGGYSYSSTLSEDMVFPSGKQVTVEVCIESGECHVTVGEIEDWTETESPIIGEAVEDLPTFKLFDFYNLNGVQGLVIALDETGKHGTLISLDETNIQWGTESFLIDDENSSDNAQKNLDGILEVDPTLEKFPAMKWCMDKNKDGVVGWYMPAFDELDSFWNLYYENMDLINEKIEKTGVPEAVGLKTTSDDTDGYFSSSVSWTGKVRGKGFSMWDTPNNASRNQVDFADVRAFYKF